MNTNDLTATFAIAASHSDQRPEELVNCIAVFKRAHARVPGGLSVEVGTRLGGSTYLFLRFLEDMYPEESRPPLWSVDPYGGKVYAGGDPEDDKRVHRAPYNDDHYFVAKKLLAPFSNHSHFRLTSGDFFDRLHGASYWERGVEKNAAGLAFCFLDGEHSARAVLCELQVLYELHPPHRWMHERGLVLVDNIDKDPALMPEIEKLYEIESRGSIWVVVSGRKT